MRVATIVSIATLTVLSASSCVDGGREASPTATEDSGKGLRWVFEYDDAGLISAMADSAGRRTEYSYAHDSDGHLEALTKELADGGQVRFAFDRFGRRARMEDALGAVDYEYDGFGRLTAVRREGSQPVLYGYDTLDRLSSVSVGAGHRIGYGYDFLGRLEEISTPAGKVTYEYQTSQGRVIRTLPNGIRTFWEYAPNGRLRALTHVSKDNYILAQFEYSYRPDGLIRQVAELSSQGEQVLEYEYDKLGRLTLVDDSVNGMTEYAYDQLGNRSEIRSPGRSAVAATYDWAGRLESYDGQLCDHDASGNLTACSAGLQNTRFVFSDENRLASVSAQGVDIAYEYDGDGNLMSRISQGSRTHFVVDPRASIWRPLWVEGQDGGSLVLWEGNTPLGITGKEGTRFLLNDHLGSVRLEVDAKGEVLRSRSYSAFGEEEAIDPASPFRPGYAGMFLDAQASVYLTRNRAYAPTLGRFLQQDPLFRLPFGSPDELTPYAYVGNDPINYLDRPGAARSCATGGCISISDQIRDAETQWAFTMSEDIRWDLFDDAFSDIADAISDTVDKVFFELEFNVVDRAIVKQAVKASVEEAVIKGWSAEKFQSFATDQFGSSLSGFDVSAKEFFGEVIKDIVKYDYSDWAADTRVLLKGFGEIAQARVNYTFSKRLSTRLGIPLRMESFAAKAAADRSVALFDAATRTAGSFLDGFRAGAKWVDVTGKAMMASNPPIYITHRTPLGLEGHGTREIGGGTFRWGETITTKTDHWWERGSIHRAHWDTFEVTRPDYQGRVQRARVSETPATSFAERFMMHWFPLGEYYDPTSTSEMRVRRTQERYQVSTKGGVRTTDSRSFSGIDPGPTAPTSVGGVYLRGAGEALAGLGELQGVAIDDESGRLVLLADLEHKVELPPLRMDDIVTIFRSVYEHGEAPFVSIDPDPKDPRGKELVVVHGDGTAESYPGWVLFEADRVMKGYSLGVDNVTRLPIESQADDYRDLLQLGFWMDAGRSDENWERFWIVPAEVNRRQSSDLRLTLLDIPLKVNTQTMELRDGSLQPAIDPKTGEQAREFSCWPPAGNKRPKPKTPAQQFACWFTEHYDEIAEEASSPAPDEAEINRPVEFFKELQQIALVTGVAETLRDNDVPIPDWMLAHQVEPIPLDRTTPSLTVEDTEETSVELSDGRVQKTTRTLSIYGGVRLAADGGDVHTESGDKGADATADVVENAMQPLPPLGSAEVVADDTSFRALSLPGSNAKEVGANQLSETDLSVEVVPGRHIGLVRKFHSFFHPDDVFGGAWTVDFPRLVQTLKPAGESEGREELSVGLQLTSPLGSVTGTFRESKQVEELNAQLLVPNDNPELLGLGRSDHERLGPNTWVLIHRDGARWFFDEKGLFAGWSETPQTTIYRRDEAQRIRRIEGWYGDKLLADIRLEYDKQGRLSAAEGSTGGAVTYRYADDGSLVEVDGPAGEILYRYDAGLVTGIQSPGGGVSKFQYSEHGQLLGEWRPDGSLVSYVAARDKQGVHVQARRQGTAETELAIDYDHAFRPLRQALPNGSYLAWNYLEDGRTEVSFTPEQGEPRRITRSPDGSVSTWTLPEGGTHRAETDGAGRLTQLLEGDKPLLEQTWLADGRLSSAIIGGTKGLPQYEKDGVLSHILVVPPEAQQPFKRWMQADVDISGRVTGLSDYTGSKTKLGYDERGDVSSVAWNSFDQRGDEQHQGMRYRRDEEGRVEDVESSWGFSQHIAWDGDGNAREVELKQDGQTASIAFAEGRFEKVRQFDGGVWEVEHFDADEFGGQINEIRTPNGLALAYRYDDEARIANVRVGDSYQLVYGYDARGKLTSIERRGP